MAFFLHAIKYIKVKFYIIQLNGNQMYVYKKKTCPKVNI